MGKEFVTVLLLIWSDDCSISDNIAKMFEIEINRPLVHVLFCFFLHLVSLLGISYLKNRCWMSGSSWKHFELNNIILLLIFTLHLRRDC